MKTKKLKKPTGEKMFIVRHSIMAKNLTDARRKSMKREPDEIYLCEDWKNGQYRELTAAIGFDAYFPDEDEYED